MPRTGAKPRVPINIGISLEAYERIQGWVEDGRFPTQRAVLEAAIAALGEEIERGAYPPEKY